MAVYTEVPDEELAEFVTGYGLGKLISYKGIAEGVENTNYLVTTSTGRYILTLYEKRVQREDLPFFLGLLEHLAGRGLTCPTPVRDQAGRVLGELVGRPAAFVTFLEGVWIRRPRVEHCAAVGRALAQLHLAGADFPMHRLNALGQDDWRPLFRRFEDRADAIAPGLAQTIARELDFQSAHRPAGLASGIIHAVLFPDNVFFLEGRLSGLIDFYFACNEAFAYDLAICLNAWCFEVDFSFNVTKGRALLKAYDGVRRIPTIEAEALPILARGAALRFLLTRAYDWINTPATALVSRKDPMEYVRRLRFHQGLTSARDYGYEGPA